MNRKLGFGQIFTDHFFNMKYKEGKGWHDAVIEPYRPLKLDPTAMCLHYAQEIFEGLKAYRGKDGAIFLFRPTENIKRMNSSAERLCMPSIDEAIFLDALKKLVVLEKDWIPRGAGTSLYIRPTMIATEPALGVHPANEYLFFIVVGPVGAYYHKGFRRQRFLFQKNMCGQLRAVQALPRPRQLCREIYASRIATNMGYTQVLWLDAREKKYVEEVGTSNIFFLIGDELITPALTGTILPGVTRHSVIQLARHFGVKVAERPLAIDEIIAASKRARLKEVFASGTAAIVSPVGQSISAEKNI